MRTVKYWLMGALVVGLVGVGTAEEKKAATIKDVMKKFHSAPKGEDPICKKVQTGKATDAELKDLVAAYEDLGKNKPPQGDEAVWKTKTTALLTATKDVAAKKDGAVDAYKKAVACGGCHSVFKPK